jgi:hypothetical protein
MQEVRFGNVALEMFVGKVARTGGNSRLAGRSFATESGSSNHRIQRVAQAPPEQSQARLGPSMLR